MKYTKIDIKHTVNRLIHYFDMQEDVSSQEEKDALLNKIRNSIKLKKQKEQKRYFWISVASAAVFIGIIGFGADRLFFNTTESDISMIAAKISNNITESDEIQLIVSQKDIIPLKQGATVSYSQEGTLCIDENEKITETAGKDVYDQIIVPKGKHTRLILADSSSLHINSGTKVIYPKRFKKNKREIFVDGEIYIDVKRNESAPFFVKTAKFEVEVLGTSFNVNAYEASNHAEVVLVRGAVKLKDCQDQILKLSPNQLAAVDNGFILDKKDVNAQDYIAWIHGLLILQSEPLERVFHRLECYYGSSIEIDPSIRNLSVRGTLDLNCSFEEILERIAITAPIKYEKTETGFLITKRE